MLKEDALDWVVSHYTPMVKELNAVSALARLLEVNARTVYSWVVFLPEWAANRMYHRSERSLLMSPRAPYARHYPKDMIAKEKVDIA